MELKLRYAPTPENAPLFAEDIVRSARKISRAYLDYSPESLDAVDQIVGGFEEDGCSIDLVKETLFGFGCYVGEVFVRTGNGHWREVQEGDEQKVFGFPIVIEIEPDNVCNPIGKVFKRLEYGEMENLSYFYEVFAIHQSPRRKRSWWRRLLNR